MSNIQFRDISVGGMILPKDTMVFPLFTEILKVAIVKVILSSYKNIFVVNGHPYDKSREATGMMEKNSSRKDSSTTKEKSSGMNISSHSLSVGIA